MKRFTIFAFSMLAVLFLFTPEVYAASDGEAISGLALGAGLGIGLAAAGLSLIHISEPTRPY